MRNCLLVGMIATFFAQPCYATDFGTQDYKTNTPSGFCVEYDNVGTRPAYLGLINNCDAAVTVETVNRHSNGTIAASRTFHLARDETRQNIGLPGYQTTITSVSPFTPGVSCDDGFGHMRVLQRVVSGFTVFTVKNLDSQRFLAVYFKHHDSVNDFGFSWDVIKPSDQNDRFWGAPSRSNPTMTLNWSCLDPL